MGKVREGKTGIKPASASVPFAIKREMWGVGALNWYPNRNPSEETKRTTGRLSFVRGRDTREGVLGGGGGCGGGVDGGFEEKKRKAKAKDVDKAMQVMMMREMKRVLWEEGDCDDDEEEEESVLKERRAFVESESCSSWSSFGIGVGFVEVNADR